jgi:hypothetical protein
MADAASEALARQLITAAKESVGHYQTEPYELQIRYACQDIVAMRERVHDLEADIQRRLAASYLGQSPDYDPKRKHAHRRNHYRRSRRSSTLPRRSGIRKLHRCCPSSPSIWEEEVLR